MHIKAINTKGEYKCIVMGHNYPIGVYWGKGYGAINRLGFFPATACVDSVHPVFVFGCSQELLLLAFWLILIVKRPFQDIFYSWLRFGGGGGGGGGGGVRLLLS